MDLKNCPECGKVFVKVVRNLCPDCIARDEKQFETVRRYVKENPGHHVEEICEVTEVPVEKVMKFIREGLLMSSEDSGSVAGITCSRCGKPIDGGKLCPECTENLRQSLLKTASSFKPEDKTSSSNNNLNSSKNRMYTSEGKFER